MLLVVCFMGCEPKTDDSASSADQDLDVDSQENGSSLLDDGFYLEQDAQIAIDPEGSLSAEDSLPAEGSLSAEGSLPAEGSQLADESDVVADAGFSAPAESNILPDDQATPSKSCVSKESKLSADKICRRISNRLASVSMKQCIAAELSFNGCLSVAEFPILLREFSPVERRDPQGRILVLGGIHGDELTSVSISFRWIEKLNKFHSGLFHWRIVPMVNPDGVLKRSASRTNNNGVDLNRNLPSDDWSQNALKYWKEKSGENERRYPGPEAASEPETQWLVDEINEFRPDAIISVHAPYGVVDYDALLLNTAPKSLGKLRLNLLGTYPGSLGNYAGINRNIPVITLELPHAWDMPSDKETSKIWEDLVTWLRKNINQPEQTAQLELEPVSG